MIIIVMVTVYGVLRIGFADNSLLDLLSTAGFGTTLLLLPDFLHRFQAIRTRGYSTTLFTLGLWVLLILLSFVPMIDWVFPYVCVASGVILLIDYLRKWREILTKLIAITFGILLSLYLITFLWGGKCHNPLYVEKIALGEAHIDLMYHATIANLMKTHGFATTGMDGNIYLPYHWASHFVAGRFSELLNIAPVKFYNFSLYVVFLPLFFKALFLAVAEVRNSYLQPLKGNPGLIQGMQSDSPLGAGGARRCDFIATFTIFALFIPLIMRVPGALYGESTLMAATLSMLIFALLFRYLQNTEPSDTSKVSGDFAEKVFDNSAIGKINFIVASLLVGVLALFKISFGFIFTSVYVYVFFRKKWYRSIWKLGVLLLSITIFATIYMYNRETGGSANAGFNPRHTMRMVLDLLTPKTWLYYSLCIMPFLFLLFKKISLSGEVSTPQPPPKGEILCLAKNNSRISPPLEGVRGWNFFIKTFNVNTLLLELLLLIPIIGFIPIAMINLKHNSVYFTCFQILFGAMVFIAILPEMRSFFKGKMYRKIIGGGILVAVITLGGIKYIKTLPIPIQQNLTIRKTLLERENLSEANDKLFTNIPQKNISQHADYQLIKKIASLNKKPRTYKRKACLWIPPTNRAYWDMQTYRRYGAPFVATSLSGISLINGRPTEEFSRYAYYQYPMDTTYDADLETVKQKAAKKSFSILIEVKENGELVEHNL